MKNQNRSFIIRTIAMSALVLAVISIFLVYHYVLVLNAQVYGKIYGESVFKGGRYEIKTLKYSYEYEGNIYFDKKDEVVLNELELGDSLVIKLLRFYPQKHRISEVRRDLSKHSNYDPEDGFETKYHMHINAFEDYYGPKSNTYTSRDGNEFKYSATGTVPYTESIGDILDKVKFNQGSLVESSIIRHSKDSLIVYQIYYYLNNYSLDAKPPMAIKTELQTLFPDKIIKVSVLDKSNPKHERILVK